MQRKYDVFVFDVLLFLTSHFFSDQVAHIVNIMTPELVENVPEYMSRLFHFLVSWSKFCDKLRMNHFLVSICSSSHNFVADM